MKRVEGSGKHLADNPEIRVSLTTMIHQSRQHGFIAISTWIYCYSIMDLLQLQRTFIII